MTMNFRTIRDSIESVLINAASGNYQVVSYQQQREGAEAIQDNNRTVTVYYQTGNFPKSAGSQSGPVKHEMTFEIEMTGSKAAEMDLSTIVNPSSTAVQIATALAAEKRAASLANDSIDELWELVYQALMSASQIDFGLPVDTLASRWLDSFRKDDPVSFGSLVVLTASAQLTCSCEETVTGDALVAGVPPIMDLDLEVNIIGSSAADDAKAGVKAGG